MLRRQLPKTFTKLKTRKMMMIWRHKNRPLSEKMEDR
ncbi:hypothetical protein L3Y34_008072 [Caenorhabditis briggsae]|uniref:Uncharacterized protein n=1 Tax=Caenorhabditis briggsae TaxID=6238 RepID=A0AAE9A4B4_CAEBR|nr:hypothetical protein L3Y34_008072 [Caenorhabditis briggsae]